MKGLHLKVLLPGCAILIAGALLLVGYPEYLLTATSSARFAKPSSEVEAVFKDPVRFASVLSWNTTDHPVAAQNGGALLAWDGRGHKVPAGQLTLVSYNPGSEIVYRFETHWGRTGGQVRYVFAEAAGQTEVTMHLELQTLGWWMHKRAQNWITPFVLSLNTATRHIESDS